MFKFGRTYNEPNKNGRIYPNMSQEELYQKIIAAANIVQEQGIRGSGNWNIVTFRYIDR